jgi:glycosyltransferase involved in cell wall biosynthesis
MKIAYLMASGDISGGHRVVFQQAEELANRGCGITLVCPEPEPTWFPVRNAKWEKTPFGTSKALADTDIRVATFWTTVAPAVRDFGGPVFHLCQGYEADFSFYAPKREEIESAYAKATHKLAVSHHIAKRLRDAGYTPVSYVGQTFDPLEFPPEEKRRFDQNPPTLLLVGIFEADVKGIREALSALAEVRRTGTEFRLRRISTWPLSIEEKALFPAHEYLIRLPPPEMGRAYRDSDLLIGPPHPEEGFDLPVLEALSSGLPALLSDTPGHRHIARSAAEYFPCADSAALGLSLANLLADRPRRTELSAMGPEEAARFRTTEVADRLLAVFTKALAK